MKKSPILTLMVFPVCLPVNFNCPFFAYSLISRQRTNRNLVYESGLLEDEEVGGIFNPEASLINLDLRTKIKDEWMGLSWAHKIKDNFSIGATGFFSIYEYRETGDLLISAQGQDDRVVMQNNRISYKQNTYGLFFKLGTSYILNDIELGANISLPHLKVFGDASFLAQDLSSGLGPDFDNFLVHEAKDLNNQRRTNLGIALGAGIPWGKSKIHATAEWYSAVKEYERISLPEFGSYTETAPVELNEAFKSIMNFGLGVDLFLSPNTKLILSASSDFNAHINSINLLDKLNQLESNTNIFGDIWHFGLGTDLNTKLGNIYTGVIYSHTSTKVQGTDSFFPQNNEQANSDTIGKVRYQRFRIILGIDLSLIEQKLEEKLEQLTSPGKK